MAISKPEHEGRLFYSYLLADGEWSELEDITEIFLTDRTRAFTGSNSRGVGLSPDGIIDAERFIIYYDEPTELDKIVLSGITQAQGLRYRVYANNLDVGEIPTRRIANIRQDKTDRPRRTANDLINFVKTKRSCFMVEISGIDPLEGDNNTNLLRNGDFELGDNGDWDLQANARIEQRSGTRGKFSAVTQGGLIRQIINSEGVSGATASFGGRVLEVESEIRTGVISFSLNSPATFDTVDETQIGQVVSFDFDINDLDFFELGFGAPVGETFSMDDMFLNVSGTVVYESQALDHRAIFFGRKIYQPEYNYSYGAQLDNSHKYATARTSTSNYQYRLNSTRVDPLTITDQTDQAIKDLEYLDFELGDGYCFYQRDIDSLDASEFFIANFSHGARSQDYFNGNSIQMTLEEHHEWR